MSSYSHSVAIVGATCHVYMGHTRLYATDKPAFLLDGTDQCILQHGPADFIAQEHAKLCNSFLKLEIDPSDLQVVSFDAATADPKLLTKFMDDKKALHAWKTQDFSHPLN